MDRSVRHRTEEINQEENERKIMLQKTEIQHMHMETLKLMCRERALRVSGLKRDLVSRLVDHFRDELVTVLPYIRATDVRGLVDERARSRSPHPSANLVLYQSRQDP